MTSSPDGAVGQNLVFGLQLRKEDHIPNRIGSREHHHQAVDSDPDSPGRRHAVLKRGEEVLVELLFMAR